MSIEELIGRYPNLEVCRGSLEAAYKTLEECFAGGGKLLIAGNGGSAADSDHIVGELMKGFVKRRPLSEELKQALAAADPVRGKELAEKLQGALPAIALTNHAALSSAFANDVDGRLGFAQQVYALARPGDVVWGISTSGNSHNVNQALRVGRLLSCRTLGLTGRDGGEMASLLDVELRAPASSTALVQELHLPLYHALCACLEAVIFGGQALARQQDA